MPGSTALSKTLKVEVVCTPPKTGSHGASFTDLNRFYTRASVHTSRKLAAYKR